MFKLRQMILMLCLILSGALCYANGTTKTGNEKDWVPIPNWRLEYPIHC